MNICIFFSTTQNNSYFYFRFYSVFPVVAIFSLRLCIFFSSVGMHRVCVCEIHYIQANAWPVNNSMKSTIWYELQEPTVCSTYVYSRYARRSLVFNDFKSEIHHICQYFYCMFSCVRLRHTSLRWVMRRSFPFSLAIQYLEWLTHLLSLSFNLSDWIDKESNIVWFCKIIRRAFLSCVDVNTYLIRKMHLLKIVY